MKNPQLKNNIWQMLFIIINSAFAVFFLNSLSFGFSLETFFDSAIYTFFIGSSVCLGILLIIPQIQNYSLFKRLLLVSLTIFFLTFVGIFLTRFLLGLYYQKPFGAVFSPGSRTISFSLIISGIFGFSAYFYVTSQNRLEMTREKLRRKELDEEKARTLATEAQLSSLESRIHPHFLFNTLNSIASLIREDPVLAEKMVEKLSALLRYSLDANEKGLVSLEQELEITRKYLAIEKVRFAERLDYKIECDSQFDGTKIPPLSLQTLVENSIKHVAAKTSGKTEIGISVKSNGTGVVIEVCDNGSGFGESSIRDGHGLDILRKRLTAVFQHQANLEIVENQNGRVKLRLPYERNTGGT